MSGTTARKKPGTPVTDWTQAKKKEAGSVLTIIAVIVAAVLFLPAIIGKATGEVVDKTAGGATGIAAAGAGGYALCKRFCGPGGGGGVPSPSGSGKHSDSGKGRTWSDIKDKPTPTTEPPPPETTTTTTAKPTPTTILPRRAQEPRFEPPSNTKPPGPADRPRPAIVFQS